MIEWVDGCMMKSSGACRVMCQRNNERKRRWCEHKYGGEGSASMRWLRWCERCNTCDDSACQCLRHGNQAVPAPCRLQAQRCCCARHGTGASSSSRVQVIATASATVSWTPGVLPLPLAVVLLARIAACAFKVVAVMSPFYRLVQLGMLDMLPSTVRDDQQRAVAKQNAII
jgi:hypothetical protein